MCWKESTCLASWASSYLWVWDLFRTMIKEA